MVILGLAPHIAIQHYIDTFNPLKSATLLPHQPTQLHVLIEAKWPPVPPGQRHTAAKAQAEFQIEPLACMGWNKESAS